jgi:uncharacterized protein YqeY
MSLEQQIDKDYIQAMKDRDSGRSSALSFLRSQIKYARIELKTEHVPDSDVIAVLKKQIKQRQDSIEQFKQGGRTDLVEKEEKELAILKGYLPAEMSADEIKSIIKETIKATSAVSIKDMGRVMKEAGVKLAGRADNKQVSEFVKSELSQL